MAGYSKTPLAKKLGMKDGHRVALLGAPEGFVDVLDPPDDVTLASSLRGKAPIDVVVLFTRSRAQLVKRFGKAKDRIAKSGGLWIAWPKRSSGVTTDLTDMVVRGYGLEQGLVDNKVCAIDETWSGLRFVWRKKDR